MAARTIYRECQRCGQIRSGPIPIAKAGEPPDPFFCTGCLTIVRRERAARPKRPTSRPQARSPRSQQKSKRAK